jgi:signal transduction histidine kinase/CheY-like chemotaxis protein
VVGGAGREEARAPGPHDAPPSAFEAAFVAAPGPSAVVETRAPYAIKAVNEAFAEVLSGRVQDLRGVPLTDVVGADEADAVTAVLRRIGEDGSPRGYLRVRCLRSDGREAVADAQFVSAEGDAPSGHAVVFLDEVGAGVGSTAAVRDSRKLVQDIIDGVPALVFIKDLDDRYILANRRVFELYGACIGQTDPDIATLEEAQQFRQHDAAVLEAGKPLEFEEWALHDGRLHTYFSLKFPLYDRHGEIYGLCGVSTDITALKRAQTAARAAKNEAERASRAKSEFLSRVSHELRTPLHSILGYGQILQMQDLAPEVARAVARIAKGGEHLLGLINDLLDVSRIEQGQDVVSIEAVHACDPVRAAADIISPLAAARGLELALDLHGGVHEFVAADPRRLQQVLLNLMANGVHYNRTGGRLDVSIRPVGDMRLRFLVSDTGPGIHRRDHDRVFLPFERLAEAEDHPEGTGLGLAVSKALVEAMGGAIGIECSAPGHGTTFYVEVERVPAPDNAHELVFGTRRADAAELPRIAGRILCIEDHPPNVELMEQTLCRAGDVTLVAAGRGDEGLRLAGECAPDLILLDLGLPDLSGEHVLARLKQDARTSAIPVLVLSADATPRQMRRVLGAGACDYLTKPLDLVQLVTVVRAALDANPRQGEL